MSKHLKPDFWHEARKSLVDQQRKPPEESEGRRMTCPTIGTQRFVALEQENERLKAEKADMLTVLEWLNLHSFTAQNSPEVQATIEKARGEE